MSNHKFARFDEVRLKYGTLSLPKHTLGSVVLITKHTVHVCFPGSGVAILDGRELEPVPKLKLMIQEQLELFKDDDQVLATRSDDKIIISPYLGTAFNLEPFNPDTQIVTTKRELWKAYINSTCFEELCEFAGFGTSIVGGNK